MSRVIRVLLAAAACLVSATCAEEGLGVIVAPEFVDMGTLPAGTHLLEIEMENASQRPARCTGVTSSCSCAVVDFDRTRTLAPGERTPVTVRISLEEGQNRRAAFVFTFEGGASATVQVVAKGGPPAGLRWHRAVDLGGVTPGVPRVFRLEVHVGQEVKLPARKGGDLGPVAWFHDGGAPVRLVEAGPVAIRRAELPLTIWALFELTPQLAAKATETLSFRIGQPPGLGGNIQVTWEAAYPVSITPEIVVLAVKEAGLAGVVRIRGRRGWEVRSCEPDDERVTVTEVRDSAEEMQLRLHAPLSWADAGGVTLLQIRLKSTDGSVVTVPLKVVAPLNTRSE